jgi:hypothetical protein
LLGSARAKVGNVAENAVATSVTGAAARPPCTCSQRGDGQPAADPTPRAAGYRHPSGGRRGCPGRARVPVPAASLRHARAAFVVLALPLPGVVRRLPRPWCRHPPKYCPRSPSPRLSTHGGRASSGRLHLRRSRVASTHAPCRHSRGEVPCLACLPTRGSGTGGGPRVRVDGSASGAQVRRHGHVQEDAIGT